MIGTCLIPRRSGCCFRFSVRIGSGAWTRTRITRSKVWCAANCTTPEWFGSMQLSLCGCAAPVYFALSLNAGAVNFRRASPESDVPFDSYGARKHEFAAMRPISWQTVSSKLSSLPARSFACFFWTLLLEHRNTFTVIQECEGKRGLRFHSMYVSTPLLTTIRRGFRET